MKTTEPRLLHRLRFAAPGVTGATPIAGPAERLVSGLKTELTAVNTAAAAIYEDSSTSPLNKAQRLVALESRVQNPANESVGYFRRELLRLSDAASTELAKASAAMVWDKLVSEPVAVELRTRLASIKSDDRDRLLGNPAGLDARTLAAVMGDPLAGSPLGLAPAMGGWVEAAERAVFPAETARRVEAGVLIQLMKENVQALDKMVVEMFGRPVQAIVEAQRELRAAAPIAA